MPHPRMVKSAVRVVLRTRPTAHFNADAIKVTCAAHSVVVRFLAPRRTPAAWCVSHVMVGGRVAHMRDLVGKGAAGAARGARVARIDACWSPQRALWPRRSARAATKWS